MKANELMIGDYVQELSGDVCQVIVLDRHAVQVETLTGTLQGDTTRYLHEAEGIPITPEILEKNGFLQDSNQIFYLKENIKFGIKKDIDYGYWFTNRADNYKEYICTCDFVHELQHILKLCKIEKEIVL